MSVHMIRVKISTTGSNIDYLINDYIPQWLINHTAWTDAEKPNEKPVLIDSPSDVDDTPAHYAASWRFSWGDNSKSVLLDNLKAYIDSYSDWAVIGYHVCDHDKEGSERGGCSWDDIIRQGNVPAEVDI